MTMDEKREADSLDKCLPTHIIIFEIVSRLGIKTLINCRLVCKRWAELISTPEFASLHLSRSPASCLMKPYYLYPHHTERLHLFDLESPFSLSNKLLFTPNINLPDVPIYLTNSCNGFVCLCDDGEFSDGSNIYVCNPVLKEYISLPIPSSLIKERDGASFALGFSEKTNQYKVLLTSCVRLRHIDNPRTYLYTLGEGSWRSIENPPYHFWDYYGFNAFLNGALHWIPRVEQIQYRIICCFDFETEQFRRVPEPSEFGLQKNIYFRDGNHGMMVGVINGKLSIFGCGVGVDEPTFVIWVMNEYGVKESWTKDICSSRFVKKFDYYQSEPIMITSNGEILFIVDNKYIMLYDPKSHTLGSEMKISEYKLDYDAISHVPSLISLKDVAKGETLKVLGSD